MNRDTMKECFALLATVERALEALPYRDAFPAIRAVSGLREMVGSDLPGGLAGRCTWCDDPIGIGEDRDFDEEGNLLCGPCADQCRADAAGAPDAADCPAGVPDARALGKSIQNEA